MGADLRRPWNIVEQVVEDPTTKLRIEFTSVHTEAMKENQGAPRHDNVIYLRVWTTDRTRVATYAFTRAGDFIKTAVEHVDPGTVKPLDDGIAHAQLGGRPAISDAEKRLDAQQIVEAQKAQAPIKAADPGLEAAQQARFQAQGEQPPIDFEKLNYADQFVGDIK